MNLFVLLLGAPGPFEIIIIVIILLILFGGKKIPELMKGLGQGMKEFKKARSEEDESERKEDQKQIDKEKN